MLVGKRTPSEVEQAQNRRTCERVGFRTAVTTIARSSEDTPQVFRAWTNDISASGAQLICDVPIPSSELCLRVFLPGFVDRLVTCRVVRCDAMIQRSVSGVETTLFQYGVKFIGVHSDVDVDELVSAACGLVETQAISEENARDAVPEEDCDE